MCIRDSPTNEQCYRLWAKSSNGNGHEFLAPGMTNRKMNPACVILLLYAYCPTAPKLLLGILLLYLLLCLSLYQRCLMCGYHHLLYSSPGFYVAGHYCNHSVALPGPHPRSDEPYIAIVLYVLRQASTNCNFLPCFYLDLSLIHI